MMSEANSLAFTERTKTEICKRDHSACTAIFGGTFDPVHLGHLALARSVYDSFRLDELIFMPAKFPPHKSKLGATPKERFEMVSLMAAELKGNFSVSDFEIKSEGVSYTWFTLKYFRERRPKDILYFVAGSDIFASIASWERYEELFELSNFIVVNRDTSFEEMLEGMPKRLLPRVARFEEYEGAKAGKIILYYMTPVKLSSADIRGEISKDKLPLTVYNYIRDKKIYEAYR